MYNLSIYESIIRIFVAILIAAAGGVFNHWFGVLAVIPFVTGLAGYCPIYHMLGRYTSEGNPYAAHGKQESKTLNSAIQEQPESKVAA